MREASVKKRRKRASEIRSNVDGEQEEEEDADRKKKRVKLSAGPVGKGKERKERLVPTRRERAVAQVFCYGQGKE